MIAINVACHCNTAASICSIPPGAKKHMTWLRKGASGSQRLTRRPQVLFRALGLLMEADECHKFFRNTPLSVQEKKQKENNVRGMQKVTLAKSAMQTNFVTATSKRWLCFFCFFFSFLLVNRTWTVQQVTHLLQEQVAFTCSCELFWFCGCVIGAEQTFLIVAGQGWITYPRPVRTNRHDACPEIHCRQVAFLWREHWPSRGAEAWSEERKTVEVYRTGGRFDPLDRHKYTNTPRVKK